MDSTCPACNVAIQSILVPYHMWAVHEEMAQTMGLVNPFVREKVIRCPICYRDVGLKSFRVHLSRAHTLIAPRKAKIIKKNEEPVVREKKESSFLKKYFPTLQEGDRSQVNCPLCGRSMMASSFNQHCAKHHSNHQCWYCDQTFPSYFLRKHHMSTVHNANFVKEKQYKCNLCYKSFVFPYLLETHIKAQHQNQRNFLCDLCGKRFRRKTNLKKHKIYTHLNLKLNKCRICNQTFKAASSCKKHIKNVHNIIVTGRLNNPITGPYMPMMTLQQQDMDISDSDNNDFQNNYC